ncbi:MAG TPA: EamA family transporter [Nakamurella multipartita]|nr:EamA family transporter [Nakamurella multipartita]
MSNSADDDRLAESARTKERALTLPNLLLLLFAVLAAATGQLMLKHGMTGVAAAVERDGGSVLIRAITAPWVWAGLVVFGISALAWLTTLSRVPLSVAYPFNALGLLTIVGASAVILHEKVTPLAWVGVVLVGGGLVLVVLAQQAAQ